MLKDLNRFPEVAVAIRAEVPGDNSNMKNASTAIRRRHKTALIFLDCRAFMK